MGHGSWVAPSVIGHRGGDPKEGPGGRPVFHSSLAPGHAGLRPAAGCSRSPAFSFSSVLSAALSASSATPRFDDSNRSESGPFSFSSAALSPRSAFSTRTRVFARCRTGSHFKSPELKRGDAESAEEIAEVCGLKRGHVLPPLLRKLRGTLRVLRDSAFR
jgi:hypothetical protein